MPTQKQSLVAAMIIVWIILALQIAASVWYLYWILPWFDMMMHFLGGVWLGCVIYALFPKIFPAITEHKALLVFVMVAGALLFGFLWEIMEFVLDLFLGTSFFQPDLPDTLSDLVMDTFGAIVSALGLLYLPILHKKFKK